MCMWRNNIVLIVAQLVWNKQTNKQNKTKQKDKNKNKNKNKNKKRPIRETAELDFIRKMR